MYVHQTWQLFSRCQPEDGFQAPAAALPAETPDAADSCLEGPAQTKDERLDGLDATHFELGFRSCKSGECSGQ